MYNEKKLKFWAIMEIVKKWFIILVLIVLGVILGFFISEFVVDVLNEQTIYRIAFIGGFALVGFFIGMLLTANVERNVQDAFWKIEVMHKLEKFGIDELSVENGLSALLNEEKTKANVAVSESNKNDNTPNTVEVKNDVQATPAITSTMEKVDETFKSLTVVPNTSKPIKKVQHNKSKKKMKKRK